MKPIYVCGLTVMAAAGLSMQAMASMVQYGLYDTGVDNSGNSLAAGSTDSHYNLDGGAPVVVNGSAFPIPPWVDYSAGNGSSRWISVDSGGGNANLPIADHVYTTTFTLSGLASVTLSGLWASDNAAELFLNNHLISTIPFGAPGNYSFQQYSSFSTAVQGFFNLNGVNNLEFLVHNGDITQPDGNPGGWFGVRAESLDITGAAVPEPTTMIAGALLLLPFGLGAFRSLGRKPTA